MEIPPEVAGLGVKLATSQAYQHGFWKENHSYQMAVLRFVPEDGFRYLFVSPTDLMAALEFGEQADEWLIRCSEVMKSLGNPMTGGTRFFEGIMEIGGSNIGSSLKDTFLCRPLFADPIDRTIVLTYLYNSDDGVALCKVIDPPYRVKNYLMIPSKFPEDVLIRQRGDGGPTYDSVAVSLWRELVKMVVI